MTNRSSASLQNLGQTPRTAPVSAGVRINLARAIVAVGDPTRERLVLEALANSPSGDAVFQIARRCLDADDLMHSVQSGDAEVAVVGVDLHGLSTPVIRALAHSRLPLVL